MHEWVMPHYRALGEGIGELRWQAGKRQHRLLGFFDGDTWYAVLGCTHKQRVYQPPSSLETAKKRKKQIERGEVQTVEFNL